MKILEAITFTLKSEIFLPNLNQPLKVSWLTRSLPVMFRTDSTFYPAWIWAISSHTAKDFLKTLSMIRLKLHIIQLALLRQLLHQTMKTTVREQRRPRLVLQDWPRKTTPTPPPKFTLIPFLVNVSIASAHQHRCGDEAPMEQPLFVMPVASNSNQENYKWAPN